MPLTQQQKDHVFGFIGYGVETPRYVFIGPEEWSEGMLLNVEARSTKFPAQYHDRIQACVDLAAAYQTHGHTTEAAVYTNARNDRAEKTWTIWSDLLVALRAAAGTTSTTTREYEQLGTTEGDTLLAELFPLPKPGTGNWPASYVAEFCYADQGRYYDAVWPRNVRPGAGHCARADALHAALHRIPLTKQTMVFGYGRGSRSAEFWARFDRLFGIDNKWTTVIVDIAEIARHASGAVVARLAHPSGRNSGAFSQAHIPRLVAAIAQLPS